MSQGTENVVNVDGLSQGEVTEVIDEAKRKSQLKARLVEVLDRGITGDRLHVPLPKDVYGEWVRADKMEIYRMEAMGFKIDKEYASKRALHDEGTGGESRVADVVFMTCPREIKDIIDEIKREQYEAANKPRGGSQREERDFVNDAQITGLPSEIKSRVDEVTLENIKDALTSKD